MRELRFLLGLGVLVVGCSASGDETTTSGAGAGGASSSNAGGTGTAGAAGSTSSVGQICTPGEKACDGNSVTVCKPDGSGFDVTPCPPDSTCTDAICVCTVGTTTCSGDKVLVCGPDGRYTETTCPAGTTCKIGFCGDIKCPDEEGVPGSTALPNEGWPRYGHDNRNSSTSPAVVADDPAIEWKIFIGGTYLNPGLGGLATGAVINQNNIVFIGAGDNDGKGGYFYAFDASSGPIYAFNGVRGYGWSHPAVRFDGTAYYGTADGSAYAVAPNGTQAWKFTLGYQNDTHPIVTKDGYVIYGSDEGEVFALKADGSLLWQTSSATGPGETDSALAETCDGVIYAGGKNGWFALDAQNGSVKWSVPATGQYSAGLSSPAVTYDGTLWGVDSGGIGYAIDATGAVKWSKQLGPGGPGVTPMHLVDKLYVVLADGALHAVDAATGNPVWQAPVNNAPEAYFHQAPISDGKQRIYFNSNDGNVYAFDTAGNQLWKKAASGVPAPGGTCFGQMSIGKDGALYVPGNDGYLYKFK